MYRILCFGDSNTWGFNPVNGLRLSERERWPGVLRENLGSGFEIIEEGQNGRRILECYDAFEQSLAENDLLDVIIIFLGINDICFDKEVRIDAILNGLSQMLGLIRGRFTELHGLVPEVIFMGAVPINEIQVEDCLYELEAEKVLRFIEALRQFASREGCGFIDSGRLVQSSDCDGIHLEASEHLKLGLFVGDYIRTFLTNSNLHNKNH